MRWEMGAAIAAGIAVAAAIVLRPRLALLCLGLLSLLLGLNSLAMLKVESMPALVAVLGGIGLLGLGALTGVVEDLRNETRLLRLSSGGGATTMAETRDLADAGPKRDPGKPDNRVEPRL